MSGFNFNFHNNEFDMYNQMQDETVQQHGITVQYLPRQLKKHDLILGEDPASFFDQFWDLTMYVESAVRFNGQGDLFAKFGLTISDQISLKIQMDRFNTETSNHVPLSGDLIYVPMGKWIFEIFHVEDEDPWYTIGKPMNFRFECRMFEYANEEVNTNIPDVDNLNDKQDVYSPKENDEFANEINTILDDTEKNPFGNL